MPSTYTSLHYHVVFATKGRRPQIADNWQGDLHDYIGGTIRGLGGSPEQIGGVEDHVHALFSLKPTHCLSDVVREVKKASNAWVRDTKHVSDFAWQEGYSAFSVSASMIARVRNYIANQAEHHKKESFQEELARILAKLGLSIDPRDQQ